MDGQGKDHRLVIRHPDCPERAAPWIPFIFLVNAGPEVSRWNTFVSGSTLDDAAMARDGLVGLGDATAAAHGELSARPMMVMAITTIGHNTSNRATAIYTLRGTQAHCGYLKV